MKREGRAITILLILLSAASIVVAGIIYLGLEKEKGQSAAYLKKSSSLEEEKASLEKEINRYKSELSQANTKLGESEKKIRELLISLDQEKSKNQDLFASLNKELEETKKTKADLEKKISQNDAELGSLKAEIEKLQKAKEDLEKRMQGGSLASSDVQLGKIVVASEGSLGAGGGSIQPATSTRPTDGKILVVNKEYAFVVVNLGSRDGISSGDTLSVYQKNKYIGDIIVERVDIAMSSANFADPGLKDTVKEDDRVTIKPR